MGDVSKCKERMPLPALWSALGLAGEPRKNMRSPFREDRSESFSCWQMDGKWFWRDHAADVSGDEVDLIVMAKGCEKAEAMRVYHDLAGVEWVEAARKYAGNGLGRIVKVYDYLDAEGRLVHQTVRFDPKAFRQRRPAADGMVQGSKRARRDGDGRWWIWTLEGIRPVLYRLPELLARPDEEVWVTEGEKDADALAAHGVLATTCPMGAKKWRPWHTDVLAGRRVTLCGDADEAGERHVEAVGEVLADAGCRVDVVRYEEMEGVGLPVIGG